MAFLPKIITPGAKLPGTGSSEEFLNTPTVPPWMYKGSDGQWYSDYDPSAPPRPDGSKRYTETNPLSLPTGQTLKLPEMAQDPTIPTAPLPTIGKRRTAPRLKLREDNRTGKAERFRANILPTIGGSRGSNQATL